MASSAFAADKAKIDGMTHPDVAIEGIKDGKLQMRIRGRETLADLSQVEWLELEGQPSFNRAENSRKDAKAAATAYQAAIRSINDKKLKTLAELRSVEPLDRDGKYVDAVTNFLNVYAASPTDSIWQLRPTNVPAAGSTMLKTAADRIKGKLSAFPAAEAKRNLETWQMELLTKGKDPEGSAIAARLNGAPADTVQNPSSPAPAAPLPPAGTPSAAPAAAPTVTGEAAVQMFYRQAADLEKKGDNQSLALAAATLLRIPAHYPSSPEAPNAMLRAADTQKKLKQDDEAIRIYQAIVESYDKSSAAVRAKAALAAMKRD